MRQLPLLLAAAVLAGCATPTPTPRYEGPAPGQPAALLTVFPESAYKSKSESELLELNDVQCPPGGKRTNRYKVVADWGSAVRRPEAVSTALHTGRVEFWYYKSEGKKSCSISFAAQIVPGHDYAIKMQERDKGWLKGTDCMLGMVDMTTGTPVKLETPKSVGKAFYQACPAPAVPAAAPAS